MKTVAEFDSYVAQLANHDWTFDYSDDGSVWRRGNEQKKVLMAVTNKHPIALAAYTAFSNYHFDQVEKDWKVRKVTRDALLERLRQQIRVAATEALIAPTN